MAGRGGRGAGRGGSGAEGRGARAGGPRADVGGARRKIRPSSSRGFRLQAEDQPRQVRLDRLRPALNPDRHYDPYMPHRLLPFFLIIAAVTSRASGGPLPVDQMFKASAAGEGVAVIHASCDPCDWGTEGREAAAVRVLVDGKYSQHLLLVRGPEDADYHVTLGRIEAGEHRLRIEADSATS